MKTKSSVSPKLYAPPPGGVFFCLRQNRATDCTDQHGSLFAFGKLGVATKSHERTQKIQGCGCIPELHLFIREFSCDLVANNYCRRQSIRVYLPHEAGQACDPWLTFPRSGNLSVALFQVPVIHEAEPVFFQHRLEYG